MNQVIIDLKEYEGLKKASNEQRKEISLLKEALDEEGKLVAYDKRYIGGTLGCEESVIHIKTQNEAIKEVQEIHKKQIEEQRERFNELDKMYGKLLYTIKGSGFFDRLHYLFTGILE